MFFELLQSNEVGRARYLPFRVGRKVKSLLHLIKARRVAHARIRGPCVCVGVSNTRKQVRCIPRGLAVPAACNHARIIN